MALKTTRKRNKANTEELEALAAEGDQDAKALLAEGAEKGVTVKKPTLPPSPGLARLEKHVATVFARYADAIPIFTDWRIRMSGHIYCDEFAMLTFEMIATAPLIVTEFGVAARLRIPPSTWTLWKQEHPELEMAIKLGMTLQHENLSARGMEDRINAAGLIMAMKNSPHSWKDKVEHDIGDNIAGLIRKAEENRRIVDWTDIGGYGVAQKRGLPGEGRDVIDAEVTEDVSSNSGNAGADEGNAENVE